MTDRFLLYIDLIRLLYSNLQFNNHVCRSSPENKGEAE